MRVCMCVQNMYTRLLDLHECLCACAQCNIHVLYIFAYTCSNRGVGGEVLEISLKCINPGRCKTSSIVRAQDCQSQCRRFDSAKPQKSENSYLHGFELHGPSGKGAKLLFQVIKALINQPDKRGKERGGKMRLDSSLCIYMYMYDTLTSTLLFKFPFQKVCQEFSLSLSLLLCSGFPPLSPQVTVTLVIGLRLRGSLQ